MRIVYHLAMPAVVAASMALGTHAVAQSPVVDYDLVGDTPAETAARDVGSGSPVVDYDLVDTTRTETPATSDPGSGSPKVDYDLGGTVAAASPTPAPPTPVAIPLNGPTLRAGRSHPHVALVRKRLGIAQPNGRSANYFDDALEDAVKSFQRENGLDADGIVGRLTRRAF